MAQQSIVARFDRCPCSGFRTLKCRCQSVERLLGNRVMSTFRHAQVAGRNRFLVAVRLRFHALAGLSAGQQWYFFQGSLQPLLVALISESWMAYFPCETSVFCYCIFLTHMAFSFCTLETWTGSTWIISLLYNHLIMY